MSLNWREIDRLMTEWDLSHAFLQEIRQFDYHHILLQFYGPSGATTLLVSLKQGALRIHKTAIRRKALPKPPRFATFLKARLKGGKIREYGQVGRERIVQFAIHRGGENLHLYIKLWKTAPIFWLPMKITKFWTSSPAAPKGAKCRGNGSIPRRNWRG